MNLKIKNLPAEFRDIIINLDVRVLEVFLYNFRKKTATLKIRINNKYAVLKCISEDTPELEKKRFENEKIFYSKNKEFTFSPKYIDHGHNYLIIEYIEGVTLREKIINNINKKSTLTEINDLQNYLKFHLSEIIEPYTEIIEKPTNKRNISPEDATKKIMGLYSNLSSSGPHSTTRTEVSRLINRVFYYLSKSKVKKRVKSILISNQTLLKSGFTHGDLHLDNIVVCSNSDKPYIIDLANFDDRGLVVYDLIYFFSTLLTLLDANKQLKEYVIKSFEEKLSETLQFTLKIALIFHHVSKINSRFNSVATIGQILQSYLTFFTSLNRELRSV